MLIGNGFDGIAKVAQQVPPVGDLHGVRSPLADTVRVGTRAITRDDFDTRMSAQPGRERRRLTIRQQVDNLVLLQIDQDCAVTMATPPRPVVHPEYAWRARRGFAGHGGGYGPQQRIGTGWQTEAYGKPCAGFTAECKAEVAVQIEEPFRPARRHPRHIVEPFGEGLAGTNGVTAPKAPGGNVDPHRPPLPGQIMQHAPREAVNVRRRNLAAWTRRFILLWRSLDGHVVRRRQHAQNLQRAGNKRD
jgi:hypothetical protein